MPNETFDSIVKSKLEDHSILVKNEAIWSNIEANIAGSTPKTLWTLPKLLFSVVGVLGISGILFFVLNDNTSKVEHTVSYNDAKATKGISENHIVVKNETSTPTFETSQKEPETKPKQSLTPISKEKASSKEPIVELAVESNEEKLKTEIKVIKEETKVLPPKKEKQTEKVYLAGEIVKLRFEFQNVSGFPTKSVESWIEFPEWVDASTVKTVNHSEGLAIKTSVKEKYNTVIWVAKGNFGSDLSKMDSRGYIEYSCKIKEAKTLKEIASIKPLLK